MLAPIGYISVKEGAKIFYERKINKEKVVLKTNISKPAISNTATENPQPATSETAANNSQNKKSSNKTNSTDYSTNSQPSSDSNNSSSSNESSNNSSSSSNNNSNSSSNSNFPSCGSNYTFFDTYPINQSSYTNLVPLGGTNPPSHVFPSNHQGYYLTSATTTSGTPLLSPGNVTITQIDDIENITGGWHDYTIYFKPCNELTVYFGHVPAITDKLSQALTEPFGWNGTYTTGGITYRNRGKNVSITMTSGEQMGTSGGRSGSTALDLGAYDTRVNNSFANTNRWYDMTRNSVCVLDYFSTSLKNAMMDKIFRAWDDNQKRTQEPLCGTAAQDQSGTAQGAWFSPGFSGSGEDPHIALVHDYFEFDKPIFSVGTNMAKSGLNVGVYPISVQHSGQVNRDFDEVTSDGNIYCYDSNGNGYTTGPLKILVQLTDSTHLKVEKQSDSCGSGPWSFTSSASEFER